MDLDDRKYKSHPDNIRNISNGWYSVTENGIKKINQMLAKGKRIAVLISSKM